MPETEAMTAPIEVRIEETRTTAGVVVTVRRLSAYLLRPYRVYLFDASGNVAEVADYSCLASALHAHGQLIRRIRNGGKAHAK